MKSEYDTRLQGAVSFFMKKLDQIDHKIQPSPGYILTIPYISKGIFEPVKESEGLDQKSEVIAVGDSVIDNQGIDRQPPCKIGDTIIHAASNSETEIDSQKYRFVHFAQVHGIWEANESK